MGSGVSTIDRLRKTLCIRAYNVRKGKPDQTFEEQFIAYAYRKDAKTYIQIDDIKECLSVDAPWVDQLLLQLLGNCSAGEVDFDSFIEFLDTGNASELQKDFSVVNDTKSGRSVVSGAPKSIKRVHSLKGFSAARAETLPPIAAHMDNPPTPSSPPRHSQGYTNSSAEQDLGGGSSSSSISSLPPIVPTQVTASSDAETNSTSTGPSCNSSVDSTALVESKGLFVALSSNDVNKNVVTPKAMWRKSEIVRQERTVHYVTIDDSGQQQELTEKETTQTEVLHMECRETGEFAHRETTNFSQIETFNNEIVVDESGKEEYVHLKSVEDEFEYMDSTMPQRAAPPEQEQQEQQEQQPIESPEKAESGGDDGPPTGKSDEPVGEREGEEWAPPSPDAFDDPEFARAYAAYMAENGGMAEGFEVDPPYHHFPSGMKESLFQQAEEAGADEDYIAEKGEYEQTEGDDEILFFNNVGVAVDPVEGTRTENFAECGAANTTTPTPTDIDVTDAATDVDDTGIESMRKLKEKEINK